VKEFEKVGFFSSAFFFLPSAVFCLLHFDQQVFFLARAS